MALSGGFLLHASGFSSTSLVKVFNDTMDLCDGTVEKKFGFQSSEPIGITETPVRVLDSTTAIVFEWGDSIMIIENDVKLRKEGISINFYRFLRRRFGEDGTDIPDDGTGEGWIPH